MSVSDRGRRGNQTYRMHALPGGEISLPLDVPIAVHSRWAPGDYHEREQSTEFWVELVTAGEVLFTQDGKEYLAGPGTVYLPRTGTSHHFTTGPCGYAHKRSVCIQGLMLDALLGYAGLDACDVIELADCESRAGIIRLLKKSDRLLEKKPAGFTVELAMAAMGLLIRLGECIRHAHSTPVNRVIYFMRRNIARQITDSDMAAAAGMSVSHFHRLFKAEMKASPMQCFIEMKIEHAKGILKMTSLSIKETAYALGYAEPAYFTEIFKRKVGRSPLQFRRERS